MVFEVEEVKSYLDLDTVFNLLEEFGGNPEYAPLGIISTTICHNLPGEGSRKLYYYKNTQLFRCYTGCDAVFDIFELVQKVADIQWGQTFSTYEAICWVANRLGIQGGVADKPEELTGEDWAIFRNYAQLKKLTAPARPQEIVLPEVTTNVIKNLNYSVRIKPWLEEGISALVLQKAQIGFYPGQDQITIPHYDKNNRLIGIRGRTLLEEDALRYGKYRPIRVNGKLYNHPLGLNLYGLNWTKEAIKMSRTAIIFEAEKSVLKFATYFGWENNISVACCGSSISPYQMNLLQELGVREVIIAFDRQFQQIGDAEFLHLKKNLTNLGQKYRQVKISCIVDKRKITGYKDSPIDCGKDIFLRLWRERITL